MKRTGYILEEALASTAHFFYKDQLQGHDSEFSDYTGRICFVDTDALGKEVKRTRWYTRETAPKWLQRLFAIAVEVEQ